MNQELANAWEQAIRNLKTELNFQYDYPVLPYSYDELQIAIKYLLLAYQKEYNHGKHNDSGEVHS